MPGSWTGHTWKGEKMPSNGYATYYLRVLLYPSIRELALKVPPMGTASRLIVNDQVIGEVGQVGNSKQSSEPVYRDVIYHLPHHNGTVDIVFHISNFDYRKGGLWQIPVLGTPDGVYQYKTRKYQMEFLVFGTILFMGLYHFGLYIFKFRNPLTIVFGLICIATALRAASVGQYVLMDTFPGLPWGVLVRIEYITYFVIVALMAVFIRGLFKEDFPLVAVRIIGGIFILASVLTLLLSVRISSWLIPVVQVITIMVAAYVFYVLLKAAFRKNIEAVIFMAGLFILTVTMINDLLFYNNIIASGSYFAVGLGLYFFAHAMILARRFSFAFNEVNRLSDELRESNLTLERKVQNRTQKIENQNEELKLKNEQLEGLNEEKDSLISVIAHDLKAPFNRAKSLMGLIKMSGPLTKEQEEISEMINRSTDQGVELISDLLLLYGEKHVTHEKKRTDLNHLVAETGRIYKELAAQKEITLHLDMPAEPIEAITEPGLLARALDNLLTNAIKFTERSRNVYLALSCNRRYASIIVTDEGPGIPVEEQDLLFKRFQKLSPKPTEGESSTGLGLSIVKQIMEELTGTIEVESTPGEGSRFTVKLPIDTKAGL